MKISTTIALIVMAFAAAVTAEVYRVGDSDGWTSVGNVDYKNWSATKNFQVGDTIIFRYNRQFHNVVRVTHENFLTCNGATPYATMHSGNDSFPITSPGHYYFICTSPQHCEGGQKVDIRVPPPAPAPIEPLPFPYPPPSVPSAAPEKSPAPAKPPVKSVSPAPTKTASAPSSPVADNTPTSSDTAPANAPAAPKSDGSQLVNGMKIWFMFTVVYFYLI